MSIHYSAATGGFYDDTIHEALPGDAMLISAGQYRKLLDGQMQGLMIGPDDTGAPVLLQPTPPTQEQLLAAMRAERDRGLRASDWTQMADSPLSSAAREEWRLYRQALRDLPATITNPASIDWPTPPDL